MPVLSDNPENFEGIRTELLFQFWLGFLALLDGLAPRPVSFRTLAPGEPGREVFSVDEWSGGEHQQFPESDKTQ